MSEEQRPPVPPARSTAGHPLLRRAALLLAQMIVVFSGVFAAFALNRWQEAQALEQRRLQVYELLKTELDEFASSGMGEECYAFQEQQYRDFVEPYEAGERPELTPVLPTMGWFRSGGAWNSVVASSGDALEVALIRDVEDLLDAMYLMHEEGTSLRESSERLLIPLAGAPLDTFYDEDNQLRPAYAWYPRRLRTLRNAQRLTCAQAERLLANTNHVLSTGEPYKRVLTPEEQELANPMN